MSCLGFCWISATGVDSGMPWLREVRVISRAALEDKIRGGWAGSKVLDAVNKITCNGQPVAKLSDSPGKILCDDQTFLAYLRQVFNVPVIG